MRQIELESPQAAKVTDHVSRGNLYEDESGVIRALVDRLGHDPG